MLSFSIFVFLFSFLALVSGPQGRKKEKGRRKNEKGKRERGCWHGLWGPRSFLFSFFYFRSCPWFPSPREKERKKKNEERKREKGKRLLAWSVEANEFSIFVFLFSFFPLVSVPLRGKEGAGPGVSAKGSTSVLRFPSPCGVRRVRDTRSLPTRKSRYTVQLKVSVPLRGKEGAGL